MDYSQELPRSELSRKRIRSTVIFIAVMLVLAFLIGFLFDLGPETPPANVLSDVGDFPGGHIWFNTGRPLSLYDQLSRHVVVIFFCQLSTLSDLQYLSTLGDIRNEFREQPLAVIAVLQTQEESVEELQSIIDDWALTIPVIIDNQGQVASRFNVSAVPSLLILDAKARVSARFYIGWETADIRGIVEDLLRQLRAMRYSDIRIFHPDSGRYIPSETPLSRTSLSRENLKEQV